MKGIKVGGEKEKREEKMSLKYLQVIKRGKTVEIVRVREKREMQ